MIMHPGIGDKFSHNRRKWQIMDLREGVYTCKTIDKKSEEVKTFAKVDMIRICR